jgi:hypothetical protein
VSKEVEKKEEAQLPADIQAILDAHAGAGTDFSRDEIRVPQLKKLQANSLEVQEGGDAYVSGATPGMIYHTDTGTLAKRLWVVPIIHAMVITAMRDYDKGGGIEGVYRPGMEPSGDLVTKSEDESFKRLVSDPDIGLKPSMQYIVAVLNEAGDELLGEAIMRFPSTDLKYSRTWNTRMKSKRVAGQKAPIWFFKYPVETQGNLFTMPGGRKNLIYNWDVKFNDAQQITEHAMLATFRDAFEAADEAFFYREAVQRATSDDVVESGGEPPF